jgi:hypothetical protein
MDSRDDYAYGYSPKGERLYALKSGRRSARVNIIAGLCNQQLLAPFTIEGVCNRTVERDLVGNLLDTQFEARAETGD